MSINVVIVDAITGGTNTNVVRVITQITETALAPFMMEANRGYILTRDGLIQDVFLPLNPLVSDIYYLQGEGTGLFKIGQFGTQKIFFGDKETIPGGMGFIDSTNKNDSLFLMCIVAAGDASVFTVMSGAQGNFNMNTAGGLVSQNATNNLQTSHGSIRKDVGGSNQSFINEYELWTADNWNTVLLQDFTQVESRLTYIGAKTKEFRVEMRLSTSDTSNAIFRGEIHKNDSPLIESQSRFRNSDPSAGYISIIGVNFVAHVSLSTNDYVEPWFLSNPPANLGLQVLTLAATQISSNLK